MAPINTIESIPMVAPIACPVTAYVPWMIALSGGTEISTAESRMKTVQYLDAAKEPRAAQNTRSSVVRTSVQRS